MILCSRGKIFFGVVLFPLKLPPPGHPETTWILWFCWVLNSQVFCIQVVQNWVFIGRPTIEPMEQLGIPITWGERLWEWTWAVWQNVWSRLIPVIFPFILTIGCFLTWNAWYGHYISRLQAFQLTGDAMLDLLTDSPEAARLAEHPIGVIAEGLLLSCFLTVGRIYGKIYWDWDVTQPKPPWSTAICWIFEEFEQQVEHLQMNLSSKKWETNNEGILSWCIYVLLWIIWIFMFYSSVHQSCSFYDHFRSSWSMWKVLKGVVTLRIASKAVHSMSLKWHRPVVRSSAVEELWEFDFSDCFSRIIFQLVSGRLLRGLGPAWPLHSGGICSDGLFVRRQRPSGRSWGLWPLPRRFSIAIVRKDMWKVLKPEFRRWYPCISQVYHLRSLAKSWKNPPDSEVAVNGSSLTWLLREIFTGLDLDVIFFPQQKLRDIWTSHSQMSFSERNPRWRWQCGSTYTLLSWAREASGEWLDWLDALTPKPSECRSQSHLFEVLLWWSWWRILQESRRIQQLPYCSEFYWNCESARLGWFLFFFHSKVTQDHRVAGWARAMRAERISLKQAAERGGGGGGGGGDKDTRSLILELEKRLATAERCGDRGNQKATGDLPSLWV